MSLIKLDTDRLLHKQFSQQANQQRGSSLIEILVSMVILAIGILGIFALQTSSLKSNQNSYLRTQATMLSYDIVERMRANQLGADNGNYNNPTPLLEGNCLTAAGCSPAILAAHDYAEWKNMISASLPSGAATVCLDDSPDDGTSVLPACSGIGAIYAVKTWWDDDRDGVADHRVVLSFQP